MSGKSKHFCHKQKRGPQTKRLFKLFLNKQHNWFIFH
jgi:hypothetical protein